MLDKEFLDKVCDQIISETRIIDDKVYFSFSSLPSLFFRSSLPLSHLFFPFLFSSHCKEVYSLKNEQEIEYVWEKYKKEVTTIMDKKELC